MEEALLIPHYGFQREEGEDAFWFKKEISHPFLRGCEIVVDSGKMHVYAASPAGGDIEVFRQPFSEEKLISLLEWLDQMPKSNN